MSILRRVTRLFRRHPRAATKMAAHVAPDLPGTLDAYEVLEDPGSAEYLALGHILFDLVTQQERWVARRVERVTLAGERRFRRQVSVSYKIPTGIVDVATTLGLRALPVPLALLKKAELMSFDLRDGDDKSLPLLTRRQNGAAATAVLWAAAERTGVPLTGNVRAALEHVAKDPEDNAAHALQLLHLPAGAAELPAGWPADQEPPIEYVVQWVINELNDKFLLLADVGPLNALRDFRLAKFSAEETPQDLKATFGAKLAYRPTEWTFDTPSVAQAASYHFELDAPDGLVVAEGSSLFAATTAGDTNPKTDNFGSERNSTSVLSLTTSAHSIPRAETYNARVFLMPATEGLIRSCALSAIVNAAVLYFATFNWERLARAELDAAVAVLLVAPGVVTLAVARPGEHVLAARLVRWVRRLTLVSAALPFTAAALLVAGYAGDALWGGWVALTEMALLIAALLARGAWRQRLAPARSRPDGTMLTRGR